MEKEEVKVEYIMDKGAERAHEEMRNLITKSKIVQKFKYFNNLVPKHYNAVIVSEKEDRISIIARTYRLFIGNNGVFIRSDNKKTGITYMKTGRSNQRLKIWNGNSSFSHTRLDLIKILADKLEIDNKLLLCDSLINLIATNGMLGSILSNKITNKTEALIYYIRYSLRGLNIDINNADALYEYLSHGDHRLKILALRAAKDCNALLNTHKPNAVLNIKKGSYGLVELAMSIDEKIDWVGDDFDIEMKRLFKKGKRIKDLLQFWQGGPIPSNSKYQLTFCDDSENLPF